MNKKLKAAGLVILAGLVATAPAASAMTVEELMAEVLALQAQLNGANATVTTGGTKTYVHVNTLRVGSRGQQVKQLQTCLNRLGDNTGVVDGIFGPRTKSGVMSFQAKNGLMVDGIVGPQTGPKYEMACMVGGTTTPPTTTPTPNNNGDNDSEFTLGGDGEVTDFDLKKDGNVNTDTEDEELAHFKFEVEDGDVKLDRIKLYFEQDSSNNDDLWDNFKKITLKLDGKKIGSVDVDSKKDWTKEETDKYSLSLKGNKVIKEGFDGKLTVYVDTTDQVESGDTADYKMWGELRFVDAEGIVEEKGDDGDEISFKIKALNNFKINFRENNNSPDSNKALDLGEDVSDETLVIVDADVKDNQNGTLEDARVVVTVEGPNVGTAGATGTDALADLISELKFEIDGEEIDSRSTAKGMTTDNGQTLSATTPGAVTVAAQDYVYQFDLDEYEVKKDKKYKLTVKADFTQLDSTDKLANAKVTVKAVTFKGENQEGNNISFGDSDVSATTAYAPEFVASPGDITVTWVEDPIVFSDDNDANTNGDFILIKVELENETGADIDELQNIANWVFDVEKYNIVSGTSTGVTGKDGAALAASETLADGASKEFWIKLHYDATSTQDFKVELEKVGNPAVIVGNTWSD